MREIIIRAYDIKRGIMLAPSDLIHLEGEITKGLAESAPYLIPMEYTGLKDKNGKKIFEGDILKLLDKYLPESLVRYGVVCFKNGYFGIEGSFILTPELLNFPEHFEIVGNVYENKDLLK